MHQTPLIRRFTTIQFLVLYMILILETFSPISLTSQIIYSLPSKHCEYSKDESKFNYFKSKLSIFTVVIRLVFRP